MKKERKTNIIRALKDEVSFYKHQSVRYVREQIETPRGAGRLAVRTAVNADMLGLLGENDAEEMIKQALADQLRDTVKNYLKIHKTENPIQRKNENKETWTPSQFEVFETVVYISFEEE